MTEDKKISWDERFKQVIKPENEYTVSYEKPRVSPCYKYIASVKHYWTNGPNSWSYSLTTITESKTGKILLEVPRNYASSYGYLKYKGHTWLLSGNTYTSQLLVNLETGQVYNNLDQYEIQSDQFCWFYDHVKLSPDEKTLMVSGCYWGSSDMIKFYDFTDISSGWKNLKIKCKSMNTPESGGSRESEDLSYLECDHSKWLDNGLIEITVSVDDDDSDQNLQKSIKKYFKVIDNCIVEQDCFKPL